MAAIAGLSRHHFLRTFRRLAGMTPYRYLLRVRMARAARRLAATRDPIIAIALEAASANLDLQRPFPRDFRNDPVQISWTSA